MKHELLTWTAPLAKKEARIALALAVSLWIAGGGVASATATADLLYIDDESGNISPTSGYPAEATVAANGKKLSVTGGDWSKNWYIHGGRKSNGNLSGYTLELNNAQNISYAYGGRVDSDGNATGNTVTIKDSTVDRDVYGGRVNNGNATGNTVNLKGGVTVGGFIFGGFYDSGSDEVTGNTLNLSGENTAGSVANFATVNLESATWGKTVLTADSFGNVTNINASDLAFTNPGAASGSTTLLSATSGLDTPTLTGASHTQNYTDAPLVAGVTIDGTLTGNITKTNTAVTYTATSNTVSKLTFGDVAWKDSDALYTRPDTITFAGADVDTTNINFTNIKSLEANKKMTLVANFGANVGTITGTKYKVGSTLEGEGKASLVGNDLIFTAETGVGMTAREQTHNTVMGASVSMTALSMGNEFVGAATEGLAAPANVGADGVSSFAQMGGGSMRQETGSHVDTHTWNAILALGHQNKKERGTMEYGAFFEYGTGNYTTHAENDLRGDGSARYTGGGLLAKYTTRNNVYVEGSLRAGSVHNDARNVMSDAFGNPYSYDTNAPYLGFHLGVGKEIALSDGNSVDVYGKYFFNRKNGVSFNAGGHYDLDAVTSSVIRFGARYTVKRDKWNFYGGLAYEHELDGKATGTADGAAIRAAETKGGSARLELGATMKPGDNSPWSLDLNLSGFAGKKQGITGGVSVAFMF